MLVRLFPRPDTIDLENVLALLVDFNALSGDRPTENDGHEIIINRALFQVGNKETCASLVTSLLHFTLNQRQL